MPHNCGSNKAAPTAMQKPMRYPADQAALDALFSNRARWPNFDEHFARWQKAGREALRVPGWSLDVPYGPGPRQVLDLIRPVAKTARRAPLFAFIHGGYWQSLEKGDVRGPGPAFAAQGIAYATLDYALCPDVTVGAIVDQMRAAIKFLWREAPRFGCAPDRIYVGGHSAGGQLAAMLASDPTLGVPIKGYFSVSGVYDLAPLQRSYLQTVLRLTDREVATLSPLKLKPNPGTNLWLTVGGDELGGFVGQQTDFAHQWRKAGAKIVEVPAPGLGHFDIVDQIGNFRHPIGKAALAMIGQSA
jgi:arylformamidase